MCRLSESKLVTPEQDGRIDYRRFLQRYVLVQDASESVRLVVQGMLTVLSELFGDTGVAA